MRSSALLLVALLAVSCAPTREYKPRAVGPGIARATCIDMFARGYVPDRSGQIFLVPEKGNFLISNEDTSLYGFMHGSPWEYDVDIPLLFYGEPFVQEGEYSEGATLQDVAPTLLTFLNSPVPTTMTGRVLVDAVASAPAPPAIIALLVLDGMGRDTWNRLEPELPTLSRLRKEGAWYPNAALNYLPTVTSSGHATIATGTDPRFHGIHGNSTFDRTTGKRVDPFPFSHPKNYKVPTLTDYWASLTGGSAVILVQGTTSRATVALAGHGACRRIQVGGVEEPAPKSFMAMFDDKLAGWVTNRECYRLPEYLLDDDASSDWKAASVSWLGHEVESGKSFLRTGLFPRFQVDALLEMIAKESVGRDTIPDLVLVNFKTPDYVSHQYGPASQEMSEALIALDEQIGRLIGGLDRAAGPNRTLLAITADHGMPPEPDGRSKGRRFVEEIVASLHARFDSTEKLILDFEDANHQIYVDRARLEKLNLTMRDLTSFLEGLPWVRFAFTEDEIRSAKL